MISILFILSAERGIARFDIQSLFFFCKKVFICSSDGRGNCINVFYKLDRFSEDIALDAKGSLPKVEKIFQEIVKENKWKYKITKNADTVFRMMIDYGGKMI